MLKNILIEKKLSNREAEVAELVSQGLSNREVANRLFVTEKTIKFHLTNIYKKMDVKSRAQLIVWCMPHTQFINSNQTNQSEVVNSQPQPQPQPQPRQFQESQITRRTSVNTIPAGSTTVSSSYRNPNRDDYTREDSNSDKGNNNSGHNGPFRI